MLPNFVVIGAMKSGTSSLYEYLQAHPRIFMPEIKEPDYFATAESFDRRGGWYEALFRDANGARAVGEASTSYTKFPDVIGVPERMAKALPDVRLIYVVRDPIERIRSQYLHELLMSEQREPLEAALSTHARYVNYSRYWMQIQRFLEWFPADRLLVIKSESLRDERRATLASICRFLGVDPGIWRTTSTSSITARRRSASRARRSDACTGPLRIDRSRGSSPNVSRATSAP